jgi:hypothetical protein
MKIEKIYLSKNIILLKFASQRDLASTFLRFQEYFESPKFRGKIFTLNEYKKWYAKQKGAFTYYSDWNGFNIPSNIFKPFYSGKFDPLSVKERKLLNLLAKEKGRFYIIALSKDRKMDRSIIKHEIAHALYYLNKDYMLKIMKLLSKYNLRKIQKELHEKDGYSEEVINDELHAWILASSHKLKSTVPMSLKLALNMLFQRYNKVKF